MEVSGQIYASGDSRYGKESLNMRLDGPQSLPGHMGEKSIDPAENRKTIPRFFMP